jgi:hypothetical protein
MPHATAVALRKDNNCEPELQRYRLAKGLPAQGLPAVVVNMLAHFNGERSLAQVCQRSQISVKRGRAIVKKLTTLGILETVPNTTLLSGSLGFSAEEEAFFASEVEPIDECDEPFESVGQRLSLLFSELILRLRGNPVF